jgi:peptidoglycan/xylan/chitin deacetylase (PgdA/CDA1 family)
MRFLSPLLKRVVYPSFAKAGVFRRTSASGLAVVTYHGILPPGYVAVDDGFDGNLVTAEMFRRQIRLLKNNYSVISPEQFLLWEEREFTLPPRSVLLTCDDGLLNNLTDMLPVLEEEGVRCLFFVTGASAGKTLATLWYEELFLLMLHAPAGPFEISTNGLEINGVLAGREQRRELWWKSVKRLSQVAAGSRQEFLEAARLRLATGNRGLHFPSHDLPVSGLRSNDVPLQRRFRLLNPSELRQLQSAGMTIGAHTMSHPVLSCLPLNLVRAEIGESRAHLEAVLGKRIWAFAYPFGDQQSVTPEILDMAKEAGFAAAFLNYGGGLGADLPAFSIPRIHVTASMSLSEFEAHVAGFHSFLQRSAGRRPQTGSPDTKAA